LHAYRHDEYPIARLLKDAVGEMPTLENAINVFHPLSEAGALNTLIALSGYKASDHSRLGEFGGKALILPNAPYAAYFTEIVGPFGS